MARSAEWVLGAVLAVCGATGFADAASAQFAVDQSPWEVRKALGATLVRDLQVSDKAVIERAGSLCKEADGSLKLFEEAVVVPSDQLRDRGNYLTVVVRPGQTVDLAIDKGTSKGRRLAANESIAAAVPCSLARGHDLGKAFTVTAIDGKSSVSDWVKSLK